MAKRLVTREQIAKSEPVVPKLTTEGYQMHLVFLRFQAVEHSAPAAGAVTKRLLTRTAGKEYRQLMLYSTLG